MYRESFIPGCFRVYLGSCSLMVKCYLLLVAVMFFLMYACYMRLDESASQSVVSADNYNCRNMIFIIKIRSMLITIIIFTAALCGMFAVTLWSSSAKICTAWCSSIP